MFVTLEGDKIKLATPQDDFILGIVSASPSIVGDSYDDQWCDMHIKDVFGRIIYDKVSVPNKLDSSGKILTPAHIEFVPQTNPEYDSSKSYIGRSQRPEWDAVGIFGKLVAIDDGSCVPNGWCKVGENGTATISEERTPYRVMSRIDDKHIKVFIK